MIMSANVQDQVQCLLKSIQNVLANLPTRKVLIWVRQQWESNVLTIWLGMFGPPLVLLRRLCLQSVYEGCTGWTYWSWRRIHGTRLLLMLLQLYYWPRCVWLWRLCRGEFHHQGDSSHLECFGAFSEWNHSATWRNCPAPDQVCLMNPVQNGLQIPSSLSRARRNGLTSHLGIPSHPFVSGSLHGFPNARWRCQQRMKKFPRFFSCVARATVIAVIGTFVWFSVCWWRESAEHRTSFGLPEWLLTLLVERSQEGVSFIFPSLQSHQVFILTLARLPKLASLCNLVVISPAALESLVDLVRPGFVIWNIETRISVRTQNTNNQQEVSNLML